MPNKIFIKPRKPEFIVFKPNGCRLKAKASMSTPNRSGNAGLMTGTLSSPSRPKPRPPIPKPPLLQLTTKRKIT